MATSTDPAGRRSPMVVVSRRALPGRRRAFERWLRELEAAARRAPGFVGLQITEPDDRQPDDWAVVYRFTTADALEGWLGSDERAELLAAGDDLVAAPPREQRLAVAGEQPAPVTAVSSIRVDPAHRDAYIALHEELMGVLSGFDGFLRAELFEPVEGVQDETVIVFSFADRDCLERWLDAPERAALLARMEPLVAGDRTVNVVGGFAGWFGASGATPVRRWKQALVVLVALYPTSLLLGSLRAWALPDLVAPVGTLVANILGVAVLTWLLMPPLTRLLDPWLRR